MTARPPKPTYYYSNPNCHNTAVPILLHCCNSPMCLLCVGWHPCFKMQLSHIATTYWTWELVSTWSGYIYIYIYILVWAVVVSRVALCCDGLSLKCTSFMCDSDALMLSIGWSFTGCSMCAELNYCFQLHWFHVSYQHALALVVHRGLDIGMFPRAALSTVLPHAYWLRVSVMFVLVTWVMFRWLYCGLNVYWLYSMCQAVLFLCMFGMHARFHDLVDDISPRGLRKARDLRRAWHALCYEASAGSPVTIQLLCTPSSDC